MFSTVARAPIGRQQLLDAARSELIRSNGNLALSSLTRETGLSTGALYHHFGSKAGLLASIYETFFEGLNESIADAHLSHHAAWGTRERERTRLFVEYHFADPLALLMLQRVALDPILTELEASYIALLTQNAAINIRRGQQSGEIPTDIDADSAASYVIGGLQHGIAQQLRATPPPTPTEATDRLWRLTAGALGISSR